MLYKYLSPLIEMATGLFACTCLLRLYMQHQRIPMSARSGNPLAKFIFAVTDWFVLPLRRVLPAFGRWDLASLVGAFFAELVRFLILWVLIGMVGSLMSRLVLAAFGVTYAAVFGMLGLVVIYAISSWVQPQSVAYDFLERLVLPVLIPIRRLVPLVGGIDLSPMVLTLILWMAGMLLGDLENVVLMAIA